MTTTAMGLFDGFSEAQRIIHTLVAQGIRSEDITIIANREETSLRDVLVAAAWGVNIDVGPASRGQRAAFIALGSRRTRPSSMPWFWTAGALW